MKDLICNTYIFTEYGKKIGLGHLTRCMALYDEMETRNLSPMLVIYGADSVREIINCRRIEIDNWYENWQRYLNRGKEAKANCIIDSYIAGEDIYYKMREFCNHVLYIDDTSRITYPSGIIVNPSIYTIPAPDRALEGRIYLTGIDYVILRKEFQNGHQRNAREKIKDILVIIGGSDIKNLIPKIIKILEKPEYDKLSKHIVTGKEFENINEIESLSKRCKNVHLYYNLDAAQLYDLMKQCDFAITAAGQTIYELIAMQLPFACIQVIENQGNNIRGLINFNIIDRYFDLCVDPNEIELGKFIDSNIIEYLPKSAREKQIAAMRKIKIGKGAKHIIDAFTKNNGTKG